MQACIDIHCHVMPGVDDGSPDAETSLKMLQMAEKDGTVAMILTPHHKPMHHNVSPDHNKAYTEGLLNKAKSLGLKIKLYSGNEIYYSEKILEELENGEICTLAGSDYVLVEFHPTNPYKAIHNAVYQILGAGYIPIIAHIERYSDIVSHPSYVKELIDMGCYIQVNASSVMGKYGFLISHFTKKLIKKRLVHFVASDAHDTKTRAPLLQDCRSYVDRKTDADYGRKIFLENPLSVLKNELI
ncbi:MAG: hypothetical protein J6O61_02735 [Butyrivibrio sp.]|uniref:CpsB/CapC family capsule biosynthesis tyrosine phosphatase n=1 Tax=Butyrivibrio sp. TaxID=28121 RepID=UPI001B227068|nr:CpsB/CapC family capsule biosynthesis tyrosine phosphatase [Butyrivibrio sp.]MBO6239744.1 hypothetical protein [Butyrivibrio sp.]